MAIAQSKTREKYPLSRKKIIKKSIGSILALTFLFGFYYFFALIISVTGEDIEIPLGFITMSVFVIHIFLVSLVYFYQVWYFNVYYYDLSADFITIRKGPITPREITIPYERIQDVYVDQDLLDRLFGIYDVHLSSATISSGMEAHIDGVEKPAADGLRTMLLNTVRSKLGHHKSASPSTSTDQSDAPTV